MIDEEGRDEDNEPAAGIQSMQRQSSRSADDTPDDPAHGLPDWRLYMPPFTSGLAQEKRICAARNGPVQGQWNSYPASRRHTYRAGSHFRSPTVTTKLRVISRRRSASIPIFSMPTTISREPVLHGAT